MSGARGIALLLASVALGGALGLSTRPAVRLHQTAGRVVGAINMAADDTVGQLLAATSAAEQTKAQEMSEAAYVECYNAAILQGLDTAASVVAAEKAAREAYLANLVAAASQSAEPAPSELLQQLGFIAKQPSEGRSAPTIFTEGLANLAKEPFGWFFGKPSPLYSSEPPPLWQEKMPEE